MRVAIIGAGNVGSAIAKGLTGKHQLVFGARNPAKAAQIAIATGAEVLSPADAASVGDVVILSIPWNAAQQAVRSLGALSGKVVIDCMNPLGPIDGGLGLVVGHAISGAEIVQDWLPEASVVKTINQVGAEIIANNSHLSHRPVQFMAGNDVAAKTTASILLTDLGFDPLDAGDLTKARILEPFAMLWINQALFRGKGRNWAFAAIQ